MWNTTTWVLDARLRPVPVEVPGELYLGGVQLARGYAGRPDLSAERFVADPFGGPGERLYRTGDLVRWNHDGEIEYLGRTDFQVKLRGQRIELGEIESVIASVPGVVHAAATVASAPSGAQHLVAYVSPATVDLDLMRVAVAESLPEYMRPSVWMPIEHVSLNSAGKLDRRALPEPDFGVSADVYVAPEGPLEEQLAGIVAALLGIERVSVTESFFALGGDSIMSIQLSSAAKAGGLALSPREIFEHRTIRSMARAIAGGGARLPALPEPPGGGTGPSSLPPIVSWMIEHSETPADFADFSQSTVLAAPAGIDADTVREVLAVAVAAHPMLTASLRLTDSGWELLTGNEFDAAGAVSTSTSSAPVGSPEFAAAAAAAHTYAAGQLDPAAGRLVHAVLVQDPDGAGWLVVVIHHLGVDAVSWSVLIEDLVTVWAQRNAGHDHAVRAESTSARAWYAALAARADVAAGASEHWLSRLPQRPTDLGAVFDRSRDKQRTARSVVVGIDADIAEPALTSVPRAFDGSAEDVLLAALARAVRSWQQSRGIADTAPVSVLVEGHGRYEDVVAHGADPRNADLSRTIGWFTTIVPVSLEPTADIVHAVKAAKEERLGRPEAGIGFGVLRYADTELSSRPLPSIGFNYLGNVAGGEGISGDFLPARHDLRLPGSVSGAMVALNSLTINANSVPTAAGRAISADFAFPAGLLTEEEVTDLGDRWRGELRTLVAEVAARRDVGLSPSDVPGAAVTQADLDLIAARSPGAAVWPLSPLQRGLHFQSELASAGRRSGAVDVYVAQAVLTLGGGVDIGRLRTAAEMLLAEHRVLRSGFVRTPSGAVVAVVPTSVEVPWEVVEISDMDEADVERRIDRLREEQRVLPFDLREPPLVRFVVARSPRATHLIVTNHHIVLDGWSGPLVLADLLALYATGFTYTSQVSTGTGDFADYLRRIGSADDTAGLAAWREVLAPVDGPTLVSASAEATVEALPRDLAVLLDAETTAGIDDLTRRHGVTAATVLQFAWAVLLSRVTGERVVTFGETVSGRPADLDGVESMVGLFINTLPAVVDVDPSALVVDVLRKVQADKVAVLDHQHLGLPEIVTASGAPIGFDTLAVHESYPVDTDSVASADAVEGLDIRGIDIRDSTHYPLNFITSRSGDQTLLKLKYLPSAFSDRQVSVFADVLVRLLTTIAEQADRLQVADISLVDEADYRAGISAPVTDTVNTDASLVELFARSVAANSDGVAVSDGGWSGASLRYTDLDRRSDAIASALVARGVRTGDLVGVATARSVDLVSTILGVLKAGAGYLPLDTTNPTERLRFIISDATPPVVVTDSSTAGLELWSQLPGQTVVADVADLFDEGAGVARPLVVTHADARAYVIYTSGSTGRPKGVEVTHRDVVTLMDTAATDFEFRSDDVWTMFHSYAFDFSVWELWGPLLSGARLVVVGRDVARAPEEFLRLLSRERVTVLSQTPSAFYQLSDARRRDRSHPLSLRYVVFGGEALNFEQVRRWFDEHPGDDAVLVNMYGITETTVHVSFRALDPSTVRAGDASFIGRPLASLGIHILDDRLRPVPEGVVGEMYVVGGQLAQGYLRRPELTATRFVADPFGGGGQRLYRTGDLARRVGDDIEYLGRGDAQVQLRGFRIEFGEVEAALLSAPGVTAAAATIVDGKGSGELLVGHVVVDDPAALDPQAIRQAAAAAVPAYMVPDLVVAIDAIPLTANGKLDRAALPAPETAAVAGDYVAPASPAQEAVAGVFAEVLGLDPAEVGATTSFFDLGGNSLSATRVAARIADVLAADVSVRDIFDTPTVRELAVVAGSRGEGVTPIAAVRPRPDRIPLSFAQQRMWFINRFDAASPAYNIPAVLRLSGTLDVDALHDAVADVVGRHEVLRTTFPAHEGVPYQLVHPTGEAQRRLDWQIVASQTEIEDAVMRGFDVTADLPLRVRLWPAGRDEHVLAVVAHHIAADGESMAPLVTDVVTAYVARAAGQVPLFVPLEVQFADFAIWQHDVLGDADDPESIVGGQIAYWLDELAGVPDVLELPTDRPRPPTASQRGALSSFALPAEVGERVAEVARRRGVTPFMVVHAALAVLFARLSASEDIAIATPIAGRGQRVLDPLVGMFVNTLVLRAQVDGGATFAELLEQVRRTDLEAFAHSDVPFETLVEQINPVRSEAFSPLAQVMLTFNDAGRGTSITEALGGQGMSDLTLAPVEASEVPAQLDLNVVVSAAAAGADWHIATTYATDLFDESTIEAFNRRFVLLLDRLTAATQLPVGDIALLADGDRDAIVAAESGADVVLPEVDTVADAIALRVAATPDAVALIDADREVTFAEFGARVNVLGRELIATGVGPDVAVGVCIPRSVEMLVAIHAVVAAGGQYVPIDTTAPADRVRYMLETANANALLVADASSVAGVVEAARAAGAAVLGVDAATPVDTETPAIRADERTGPLRPDDAVYTLFTSGSTGRPKGVTLSHVAVLNRLWWGLDTLPIDASDAVVLKTPYTFDCSVPELFAPLIHGARLVILRDGGHLDPLYVAAEIARTRATMVHFVPSMLSVFLEVAGAERVRALDSVRIVSTTGEALPPAIAAQVRTLLPDAMLFNLYGPTEAAVEITYEHIESVSAEDQTVPIGIPVWNSSALVLDARLHRVPDGVPGELYLGGVQLARGYAARPDLTSERFVADPYGPPGSRLYRTGDLVRRTASGGIDYLGRTDFQVKLRGQRIELGEIESVIASAPGVVHAAATVAIAPGGGEHLVGYVAGAPGETVAISGVEAVLAESLPAYMRPTVWMVLDDMQLNSAGKIDRRALPDPVFTAGEYVAPETDAESSVAEVFADVLGTDRVSVTDSFFDLGGNSLSAMRLAARVGAVLGVEIGVRELFDAPTVRELAAMAGGASAAVAPITVVDPRPDRIPLSFAQQRMWLINQVDSASAAYNIPAVLRLSGDLDVEALHAAVIDVVTRHEVLRTTFPSADGVPYQKIARASAVAARLDWDVVDSQEEIEEAVATGFDVTRQWPIRVRVWPAAPGEHVLAVVMHHIASDGESMAPLVTDLVTAYIAEAEDTDPEFGPLPVQFADYALWQRENLGSTDDPDSVVGGQLAYWTDQLAGLGDVIELPTDRPRPPVATQRGARLDFEFSAEAGSSVRQLAQRSGTTPFMVVHAALAVLLGRLSASDDIAIGTPIANRGQAVLDPLIGMFVNTLILRTRVDSGETVESLLADVKATDLDAFANADVPFESVVEAAGAVRSDAFAPFSQVWLTFDQSALPELAGADLASGEIAGLSVSPVATGTVPARVDLLVAVAPAAEGAWGGSILFATDLFDESTVRGFAEHLTRIVDEMAADATVAIGDIALSQGLSVADLTRAKAAAVPAPVPVVADSDAVVTGGPGTPPVLLAGIFAEAARRWGPRQAVVDAQNTVLSYAELDARSNRLARWLIGRGIGAESLVALAIGRSAELLTAIWAVAKTGAGYVPIDPDYPAERVATMIEDSGAILGLAVAASGDLPGDAFDWVRVDETTVASEIAGHDDTAVTDADRRAAVRTDNVAYVIYTSGSTGRPKGVAVTHTGLANFAAEEIRRSNADEYARVLGFASPSFDASVLEYLLATVAGGVLIYRPSDAVGGAVLQDFMLRQAVTHTFLTPSVLATLEAPAVPALRVVYAGGEAVPQGLKDEWAVFRRVQNLYGPTETTIGVTISAPLGVGEPITLGGPLAGVGLMVLDGRLRPVPVGVPGELYVAGGALSRGYLDRPGLSAERFVANPHGGPGDRMYRTGDVVRWRRNGSGEAVLEYSGRSDDQVKLRGLRIELGEIESALAEYDGVRSAVVIGVGGSVATALAAYVVADEATLEIADLKTHIAGRLPAHMVPASIQVLDALPMTPVGKLDRNALPEPVIEAGEFVAPETDDERAVADVFAEVLGVEEVSVTTGFFDLGGNSLSATRLAARVAEVLDADISVRDVFESPTVRQLATRGTGRAAALAPITAVDPRPERIPLSFAQQRMWFINQFDTSVATYNVPLGVRISGRIDTAALHTAIIDVVTRHEVLRTTFPSVDGEPTQQIHAAAEIADRLDWAVVDSQADVEAAIGTGFDVTAQWPLRVRLWPVSETESVLAVVAHHIAADGESLAPLMTDLVTAYAARAEGAEPAFAPLDVQFADFALWQQDTLGAVDDPSSVLGGQLAYWSAQLAGLPDVLELPTDHPRPRVASQRGDFVEFHLPAGVADRVTALAHERNATPYMVVHAALAVLLARLAATDDVAVGTPIAGRGQRELDPLVGMFVNTLVLRTAVDGATTFDALLDRVRTTDLDAFANADIPFETLVERLEPTRSEAFAPLTQVWLTLDQSVLPELGAGEESLRVGDLEITPIDPGLTPAKVDLLVGLSTAGPGEPWPGSLIYATDLFEAGSMDVLAARLVAVLDAVTADPDVPVGAVELVSAEERAAIAGWTSGAEVDLSDPQLREAVVEGTLADLVTAAAHRFGDAKAVTFDGRDVTFVEFAARVNTLARRLIAAGVGPDVAVGLCTPRSLELILALQAIVVAGGQYVPIDTAAPTDRVEYMLDTAGAHIVVVAADATPAVVTALGERVQVVTVDAGAPVADVVAPVTDAERLAPLREDHAAYTIFTSGSTGRPKGVTVSHRSVLSQLIFDQDYYAFSGSDVFLQVLEYTFDPSVLEFFRWLYDGGRMVMMRPGEHRDPWAVASYIADHQVTSVMMVPSMLSSLLEATADRDTEWISSVRHIHTGGEALTPAVADRLLQRWPHVGLHNQYGPTEATIFATIAEVGAGAPTVPIGVPLWHVTAHVLDARLQIVPIGVAGELYLGGLQVARGYAGRPALTAERFVADPAVPGQRLYRTGDMVRWNSAGQLEYLGRTDFQVKLRGQRIELGEIEAVIASAPGVVHAAVTVDSAPAGGELLVGYVDGSDDLDREALRDYAAEHLVEFMQPAVWMILDHLPLSTAGKVDRRSLPSPDFSATITEIVAPTSETERVLAALVAGVLGVDQVSVTESFFALGGDSIMSIQLTSAARAAGLSLSPREIFELKTVRAMASAAADQGERLPLLRDPDGGVGRIELPQIVSWMLELSDTPADFADFNQSRLLIAPPGADIDEITGILTAVVDGHPALTSRLVVVGDGWELTAGNPFDAAAAVHEVHTDTAPTSAEFATVVRDAHASAAARLDPAAGALVQTVLIHAATGESRLLVVIHHLGVDAVSWPIVIEDLITVWSQRQASAPVAVRREETTAVAWYAALAEQLADRSAAELDHWLARLPQRPTDLGVQLDRVRDRESTTRNVVHRVASDTTEAVLTGVPEAFGATPNDVLQGALARAVRTWQRRRGISDDQPVSILSEGHGRNDEIMASGRAPHRADLSRTVGWFTTVAPVLLDPSVDMIHAVKAAKEERLRQPQAGTGFGLLRYRADSGLAGRPLPTVAFNFFGAGSARVGDHDPTHVVPFTVAPESPGLPPTVAGGMAVAAAVSVNVSTVHTEDGRVLVADLAYPSALFGTDDVTELATLWEVELAAVVADLASVGDPGPSPSDVPGTALTQSDLDVIGVRYPGAIVWPLSPLQHGLYFQAELNSGPTSDAVDVYVTQAVLELGGDIDAARLRTAAADLLAHHRVLRTGYVRTESGSVVAVVVPEVELPWQVVELDPAADAVAAVAEVAAAERVLPFDMTAPPLIRFVLVTHSDTASLVVTNHHILLDGWSGPLVLADVLALYARGTTFTDLQAPQAGDFGDYLRHIASADREQGLAAWRDVLAPLEEPTIVSSDVEVTATSLPRDHVESVDAELTAAIEQVARSRGVTLTTILQFAWSVLLSRLTGNQVVAFGETVSGRPADLDGVESMVGLFINTLPVVVDADPAVSIATALDRLQAQKVSVLDHQHLGLPEIVANAGLPVVFDTLTVHESYPVNSESLSTADAALTGGLQILGVEASDATHYPLNMATSPAADGIEVKLKYLPSAFGDEQVHGFAGAVRRILTAVVADQDATIGEIDLLSPADASELTPVSGGPAATPRLLADVFADVVARVPDNVAVTDGHGASLTYSELDLRSNRIGRWLIANGIGVDDIVALALPRSVDLLAAQWAVAKVGAAYLSIDPDYPAERIAHMITDSGVTVGLTSRDTHGLGDEVRWTAIDEARAVGGDHPTSSAPIDADELIGRPHLDAIAYVIYTSGSTGTPKGVTVSYRGAHNFAVAEVDRLRSDETARVLGFASPSFDASVLEWLLASTAGATLVYRPADVLGGAPLAEFIRDQALTHVFLTPTVLASIDETDLPALRMLASGGEAVPQALVDRWSGRVDFVNAYGPTEASVAVAMSSVLTPGRPVDIGGPVPGVGLLVLDNQLRPVPVGVPGDLYADGVALARGYRRRAGLTAERFVAHPYGPPGARMYRTGDVVRWARNPEGELVIDYVGRSDDQVKLRGLRIELGEIEAALASHPAVSSAVVIGVGGSVATALAAYVVLGRPVEQTELRDHVAHRLPTHMIPASITELDHLPLTPAGKLDKRALPAPTAETAEFVAADSPAEESVAAVFAEVLGVDEVSVTAGFFDLGGNSLSATRLAARTAEVLNADISVRDVFDAPTVRDLVALAGRRGTALAPVTAVAPRPDRVPLSFAQQRMWFLNRFDPGSTAYNIPVGLRLTGAVDPDALRAAVDDVVARHEILRTTFPAVGGAPVQLVHAPTDAPVDWAQVDTDEELIAAATTGFDVTVRTPFRVRLRRVADGEWLLVAIIHHIVGDGESMVPLVADVVAAYGARVDGRQPEFTPLAVQFADYAIWQHRELGAPDDPNSVVARQLAYWTRQLRGVPDVIDLPADRVRPAVASNRGALHTFEIPGEVGRRIAQVAHDRGVTPFMVVHAALAVVLSRLTATDDVTVSTPIAGRGQRELDPLVGMFVNTLILRAEVDPGMPFADLLDQVRGTDLEAFAHADVPFETVVQELSPTRSQAFAPLAQVMLSLVQPAPAESVHTGAGIEIAPLEPLAVAAQVDLSFSIATGTDTWSGSLVYATDLFDEQTVATLTGRFVALLDGLTADPTTRVGDVPLVAPAELERIVNWSSGTPGPVVDTTLPTLLNRNHGLSADDDR
ncbi:putative non-ribosomal peptide synthetase [Gordonia soli NBRC 108243]|uniref:Putative non-ribosomal peptide synthetase n=1 Tax=Gordonia soli NBRC 108243 TaxID=1223545 RepID=M0QRG1_9ACTN|nr:putative non-ribosomal peptide synthetase [Gordonia soli NBRC 108243]